MSFIRRSISVGALLSGILFSGGALAQDFGARLSRAFPAPSWQQNGPSFLCVENSCGKGSLVAMQPGKGNVEKRIRSGELNEAWLRQLADNFHPTEQGKITLIEAKTQAGPGVPSVSGFYRCTCGGGDKHVAFRIFASGDSYLMFVSMARSPNTARQNLRKIETAMARN